MIIVEGVDGSGKTTLIKELKKTLPPIRVVDSPFKNPIIQYDPTLYGSACCGYLQELVEEPLAVVDRLFFSELIFGPTRRGYLGMTDVEVRYCNESLLMHKVPVIWCDPPLKAIIRHMKEAQQDPDVFQRMEMFYRLYRSMMLIWPGNVFRYDWTDRNAFNYLLEFLGRS